MSLRAQNGITEGVTAALIISGEKRTKASAEIAFGALRLLRAGRLFWGVRACLTVTSLGELMGVPRRDVAQALAGLDGEGLVRMDLALDHVGLTDLGAAELR